MCMQREYGLKIAPSWEGWCGNNEWCLRDCRGGVKQYCFSAGINWYLNKVHVHLERARNIWQFEAPVSQLVAIRSKYHYDLRNASWKSKKDEKQNEEILRGLMWEKQTGWCDFPFLNRISLLIGLHRRRIKRCNISWITLSCFRRKRHTSVNIKPLTHTDSSLWSSPNHPVISINYDYKF